MTDRDVSAPLETGQNQIVMFALDGQRYALRLDAVERVIRAAAVTPVPETPAFILGLCQFGTERARQRAMLTRSNMFFRRDLRRGKPQPIDVVYAGTTARLPNQ